MNFFELQDFIKESYPGKEAKYSFTVECHRTYEIVMTEGKPNPIHHIECRKVKVEIEGEPVRFYPIQPHRMTITHEQMKLVLSENMHKF